MNVPGFQTLRTGPLEPSNWWERICPLRVELLSFGFEEVPCEEGGRGPVHRPCKMASVSFGG